MKIFVISSVRHAPQSLRDRLEAYANDLGEEGHQVYLPHRDTDSDRDSIDIVKQNRAAIDDADEIHVFYNPDSQGSHFELGVAFALNKIIRVIENVDYPKGKSFARVIDEWQSASEGDASDSLESIDHFVLTVSSLEDTIDFYTNNLGMRAKEFKPGRWALHFGSQKINLHEAGKPVDPLVKNATKGSADFCLLSSEPVLKTRSRLEEAGIQIVAGPSRRTGAQGSINSIYFYDPDENLIELANQIRDDP